MQAIRDISHNHRAIRALIADALVVRGVLVEDILSATRCQPHRLTPFARVAGTRITYPAVEPPEQDTDTSPPDHRS